LISKVYRIILKCNISHRQHRQENNIPCFCGNINIKIKAWYCYGYDNRKCERKI